MLRETLLPALIEAAEEGGDFVVSLHPGAIIKQYKIQRQDRDLTLTCTVIVIAFFRLGFLVEPPALAAFLVAFRASALPGEVRPGASAHRFTKSQSK